MASVRKAKAAAKRKPRRKPPERKRKAAVKRGLDRNANEGRVSAGPAGRGRKESARKSRGFEENPAEEVRPDDAEFLH